MKKIKNALLGFAFALICSICIKSNAYADTPNTSGINEYWYVLNGVESVHQKTPDFELTVNGTYTFYVSDNAGNISSEELVVDWIDTTAPVITISPITKEYKQEEEMNISLSDNMCLEEIKILHDTCMDEIIIKTVSGTSKGFYVKYPYDSKVNYKTQDNLAVLIKDNGTYTISAVDVAGNSVEKKITISTIDKESPTVTLTEYSTSSTNVVWHIKSADNCNLKKMQIYMNDNLLEERDISGKTVTESYNAKSNGTYDVVIIDEAGNESEMKSFSVYSIVKEYTLDEDANLYHVHYGSSGSTSPNGCYNEAYSSYEVTGYTPVHHDYHCSWCGAGCGNDPHGSCSCGNPDLHSNHDCYTFPNCGGDPIYGYRTRYTCTKLNRSLGYVSLKKETSGKYVLKIENKLNENAEIVSYNWNGAETTKGQVLRGITIAYPSVRPNGAIATSIKNVNESSIIVPDFGYYTCTVTYKDRLSNHNYSVNYYYVVEDFDLEPPTVESVFRNYSEYKNLNGAEFTKIKDSTIPEDENQVVGFEDNDVKVTVDGNVMTPFEKEEEILFNLKDNMSLKYIECVESGKTYTFAENEVKYENECATASISDKMLGLTKFNENGTYHFKLFDMLENEYDFSVKLTKVDDGTVSIKSVTSTPNNEKLSNSYVLRISATSYSPMYYQFLRQYKDKNFETHYEVYKDWSPESFCNITDNGQYKIKVANSSFAKNVTQYSEDALCLYDARFSKIFAYNSAYDDYRLSYDYCDTTPPTISDLKFKATSDMVMVTVIANDDYSPTKLTYTCDKAYKQNKSVFYITTNGWYEFKVTDECGNTAVEKVYIDLSEYGLKDFGIISDLEYKYLGETYKANGKTYTNAGVEITAKYMEDVDTSKILTKIDEKGKYENKFTYIFTENGTYTLYTRNTEYENENVPEVLYKDKIALDTIDKVAPTVSIDIKDEKAYITATDNGSGIGGFDVTTYKISGSQDGNVDFSQTYRDSVSYVLPLEYNVIQTISVYDNVGNKSTSYSISTDGVISGGFNDLFVVIFIDHERNVLSEQILIKGANAIAPKDIPNRTGYTFEKWSCDFTKVSSNLTVYPIYRNDSTKELDLEKVELDKSWHIALLGHTFAYSTGGDKEVGNLEENTVTNEVLSLGNDGNASDETINLSDYATPLANLQRYVYTFTGLSLIFMLLIIFIFNKVQEQKMLKKDRH